MITNPKFTLKKSLDFEDSSIFLDRIVAMNKTWIQGRTAMGAYYSELVTN